MDFILNVFQNIPDMPLIEYLGGAFAFAFLFFLFYKLTGVLK